MVGLGTHRTKEEKARIVMKVFSSCSTIEKNCRNLEVAFSENRTWKTYI